LVVLSATGRAAPVRASSVVGSSRVLGYDTGANPGMFLPSQLTALGSRPCHRLIRCPACCSTVAVTASGGRAALSIAALEP
jgi:hypothetical protein